jgi:diguanylate cyclase (GGDEF)-like protein
MPDNTKEKKAVVVESMGKHTRLLTPLALLIIFTLLFVNTKVVFTILDYIPSSSVAILLGIVSVLVLIGFYIARQISLNAIRKLVEFNSMINTLLIAKENAEDDLIRANEELEMRVHKRTAELSTSVKILKKNIAERKQMEEQLYTMSITDELTGLYNRRGFFTLTEHRLLLAKREKAGLLILYADLDNLKEVNDIYGHEEGDKLLKETAELLKESYRKSDIIARIGGDEFVIFPVGMTKDNVEIIASRLQNNIEMYNAEREQDYKLSISFGIAAYDPESLIDIDGLLAEADKLMYEQKKKQKDGSFNYNLFSPSTQNH